MKKHKNREIYLDMRRRKAEIRARPVQSTPAEYMNVTIEPGRSMDDGEFPVMSAIMSIMLMRARARRREKNE